MAIYMMRDGIAVTWISLSESSVSTNLWQYQLTATVTPSNATNKTVIWTTSDPSNVTVDSNWLVTRTGNIGTYTITATTQDWWYTASCSIAFSQGCFLIWTPILINGWYKNIENIVRWDMVSSFNEERWEIEYNKVTNLIKHYYNGEMVKLNWWLIEATYNHLIYMSEDKENRKYRIIWDIAEWDWLYTKDWYVQVIEKEERQYEWDVYNITVENNHNYFVYDWILVHNVVTWWAF